MEQQVRFVELFEGGPESRHKFTRQVPYEAHGVGDNGFRILRKAQSRAFGIEGCKKSVLGKYAAVSQGIEEGRFSRVRIAHYGNHGKPCLAPFDPPLIP